MRSIEYDSKEPIFKLIMDNYNNKCNDSDISINFCYNSLMYKFQKYSDSKNLIQIVKGLDFENENDLRALKRIVNRAWFQDKEQEIIEAKEKFNNIKLDLFSFLDSTKEPYFFILHPFYKFGQGINYKGYGYVKDNCSGLENINIATDYSFYKLGYETN